MVWQLIFLHKFVNPNWGRMFLRIFFYQGRSTRHTCILCKDFLPRCSVILVRGVSTTAQRNGNTFFSGIVCFSTIFSILFFYQSGGILRRPYGVPYDVFADECRFFQLPEASILSARPNDLRWELIHEIYKKAFVIVKIKHYEVKFGGWNLLFSKSNFQNFQNFQKPQKPQKIKIIN